MMPFFAYLGFILLNTYSVILLIGKNPRWVKAFAGFLLAMPALLAFIHLTGFNPVGQTAADLIFYMEIMLCTYTPFIFLFHGFMKMIEPARKKA